MTRLVVVAALVGWAGLSLLLDQLVWFRRAGVAERLRPYGPVTPVAPEPTPHPTSDSLRLMLTSAIDTAGATLTRALGVDDDLERRLLRAHSPLTRSEFRLRQAGWMATAAGIGAIVSTALRVPPLLGALFTLGAPTLAFLVLEQRASEQARAWQRRVSLELPVVSEQLAMLLGAGFSLGAALGRLAARGHGCCATDLAEVVARVRQGVPETVALGEWADRVALDALTRLTGVLALNRDGGDLGRLVAEEARALRHEGQRELIEAVERRAQQVWVPVTVATLVPGVLFLAVPFVEAMRLFTGS